MRRTELQPVLKAEEVEVLLRENAELRLLDVRTPGEYETVHIRGAYNVPLDRLGEHADEICRTSDVPVVLICQSGSRARRAEEALRAAGMPNLHLLEGGMNGWLATALPVERGARRLSLERQVRIVAGALAAAGGILSLLVSPLFGLLPAFIGSGLVFAGITDTCGMAMLLSRLSYNRPVSCDVDAMVRALREGSSPAGLQRSTTLGRTSVRSCSA